MMKNASSLLFQARNKDQSWKYSVRDDPPCFMSKAFFWEVQKINKEISYYYPALLTSQYLNIVYI
jgi:hypothetical protein